MTSNSVVEQQKTASVYKLVNNSQGRPQDFGLGGAKSLARSAKKKIRAEREKKF